MSKTDHKQNLSATPGTKATSAPVFEKSFDPAPGDPMYVGDEPREVIKPRRRYMPGVTARPMRVAEWKHLKKLELKEQDPSLTPSQLDRAAEKAYEELDKQDDRDEALRIFGETAPVSRSVRPSDTIPDVETAAKHRLPWTRGLEQVLEFRKSRRGFAANLQLPRALFFQMAMGPERPEISSTYCSLAEENRPLRSWAHGYPQLGKARVTTYQNVQKMLTRHGEASMVLPLNVMMIRELSKIHDAGASWPRSRGRKKGERILVGEIGIVDGTQIAAPVQQQFPKDKEHKKILHGKGREMVSGVLHRDESGNVRKMNVGYLAVTIVDMATTLPYGIVFLPAGGDERKAINRLLESIFEIWPDCPMGTLVGDGLFNNSKTLGHELVFNWGIQPVFPTSQRGYGKELPHSETEGVPVCRCGKGKLMKMKDTDGFYTAERRARDGIPRGEETSVKARIRWECAGGKGGCGEKAETRPHTDARLYTFYPRRGDHVRATERRVLMWRRNAVESVFATLKNLGIGRDKFECPKWAKDLTMEWLVAVGMLGLVARRLIHDTDAYDRALAEATNLGLLTPATEDNPSPGPDDLAVRRARKKREEELEPPILPPGFEHYLEIAASAGGAAAA
jgi:hypothetical protein